MGTKNLEEVAGAPVISAGKVAGSGTSRRLLGGVLGSVLAKGPGDSPLAPRKLAMLGVTADRLLLLNFKQPLWTVTVTEVIAAVPRELVSTIEIAKSLSMNPVAVVFVDGTVWNFEADKSNLGKIKPRGGRVHAAGGRRPVVGPGRTGHRPSSNLTSKTCRGSRRFGGGDGSGAERSRRRRDGWGVEHRARHQPRAGRGRRPGGDPRSRRRHGRSGRPGRSPTPAARRPCTPSI